MFVPRLFWNWSSPQKCAVFYCWHCSVDWILHKPLYCYWKSFIFSNGNFHLYQHCVFHVPLEIQILWKNGCQQGSNWNSTPASCRTGSSAHRQCCQKWRVFPFSLIIETLIVLFHFNYLFPSLPKLLFFVFSFEIMKAFISLWNYIMFIYSL